MGYRQARSAIQLESVDEALRTALYNYFHDVIVGQWWTDFGDYGYGYTFGRKIWTQYWRRRVDDYDGLRSDHFAKYLNEYLMACPWYEVFDFIEFCCENAQELDANELNRILERDMSGYRLRKGIIVPITDETELGTIDDALGLPEQFASARQHIVAALDKLSLRPQPDLRNAITEAVSAVESAARVVTGKHKATLGDALKVLDKSGHLHPALKEAWLKLYGYASDEHGLRHAMTENPDIDFATAKYFVVSCSAFVNLLAAKL